jgi:glycosyltransferase involved in cell wall biosynthesis
MIDLTIIIPVYNEIKTIEKLLKKVLSINIKKQLVIVDDCSNDGTNKILIKYSKKIDKLIVHKKNKGKGSAIRSAQKYVKGKYVAIQDADLEYNPVDLLKIIKFLKKNKLNIAYGSRVLNKNKYENTQNFTHLFRIWGNVFLTKVSNIINKQNLTDAHTCYKIFRSDIFRKIKLQENGFAFCPEITTKVAKKKYKIREIPISYRGRTYSQGKKINSFDGLIALYCLLKYRFFC